MIQVKRIFLGALGLVLWSSLGWTTTPTVTPEAGAFQCRTSKNLEEEERFLAGVGASIQERLNEAQWKNDKVKMFGLMVRMVCFHKIQGDIVIFEDLFGQRKSKVYQAARALLSPEDRELIDSGMEILAEPDHYD